MCGIVGIASLSSMTDRALLLTMRDSMRHRGPDDSGIWQSGDRRVGLAHRRLAIIDLSPGGRQPMLDSSDRFSIIFNGEIYNYQELRLELERLGHGFRTASDTEVILEAYRAWGEDCLARLNGMFAFALYDNQSRRLFLARDRAGEKPLFYRYTPGKFVFDSELKALMADPAFPREIDLDALQYYLAYGYVPGELCILSGVRKLAQGQAIRYDLDADDLRVWHYWQLPDPSAKPSASEEELIEELEERLTDAVRRQLVADVPIGILLSGGIDSSLVTALAAKVSSGPVRTFTISFPGHGTYDEGPHARLVARHFGTEHTELVAEPASVGLLPELVRQYDEPMADSSMVPTFMVSRLIRRHATVALGGDGGDELFGGYLHYNWVQRQQKARRFLPVQLRSLAGSAASKLLPMGLKGRNYVIGFTADLPQSIAHINVYFDSESRARLLARPVRESIQSHLSPEAYKAGLCYGLETPLKQMTAVDFKTYLVDDILVKVDRASMLTSLEVRAPWLDYRLIEFAFSRVPDSLKADGKKRKILPCRLAKRLLPPEFDFTRKQGFSLPLSTWFKGGWGEFVAEVLREAEPGLFKQDTIRYLIAGQRMGFNNTQRLFALTVFELWRREYRIALPN
jgi:asparagine synthase (glutamine-hydrolysing)